jgi:hypothetical protein
MLPSCGMFHDQLVQGSWSREVLTKQLHAGKGTIPRKLLVQRNTFLDQPAGETTSTVRSRSSVAGK